MAWIDPRKAYTYFTSNYVLRRTSNGWYLFDCPICEGRMTRSIHYNYQSTKCFKCSFRGDLVQYVAYIEEISEGDALSMLWRVEPSNILLEDIADAGPITPRLTKVDITLPDGFKTLATGSTVMARRARTYIRQRGFDIDELDSEGFGYCDKKHEEFNKDFHGYIIVPFKQSGRLVYYLGRSFTGHIEMRYKNPPVEFVGVGKSEVIFNEAALHLHNTVFVSEGWTDAKTIGGQGTATLGWSMSSIQKAKYMQSSCKNIVFAPDKGFDPGDRTTFYQKATQVALDFMDSGKSLYVVNPYSDRLTGLGKDVNEMGREAFMTEFKNTPKLTWGLGMEILTNKIKT